MSFKVIIPARYGSGRLPGKPLMDLNGKTMIQHVYERACKSKAEQVIIATDDERIQGVASRFGAEVVMTHGHHPTGTDRLQEVTEKYKFSDDQIVVNVQGDEPFIPPATIDQVALLLSSSSSDIALATLSCPVAKIEDIFNPDVVKVIMDKAGCALYFSRAPVPWDREAFIEKGRMMPTAFIYQRHLGIYAYRTKNLNDFVKWETSPLEATERLEQLRFLWNGHKIRVAQAVQLPPAGIDTADDLSSARKLMIQQPTSV